MSLNIIFKTFNKNLCLQLLKSVRRNETILQNVRFVTSKKNISTLDFQNEKLQNYLESLRKEFYLLRTNNSSRDEDYLRMVQLTDVVKMLEEHRALKGNMPSQEDIEAEKDEDMKQLIKEEVDVYMDLMKKTETELMEKMLTLAEAEHYPSLIFEVNAGAGGQEAMLFAKELFEMYTNYFDNNSWDYQILTQDITDIGGLRHAYIIVNDKNSYKWLRHEAGVHRVQRVPATEKSGRMHTSTASVAVIPRPSNVNVVISDKDLKIETKRASGAGGQHVNTTDSAVRLVHIPTGIAIESQSERSQIKNKELALKKLQAKLVQMQLESSETATKATRKAQQGNLDRNEKIRTYNFVQDRITDHRIQGGTVHNLKVFLEGGEHLNSLIEKISTEFRRKRLAEMVDNWKDVETIADKDK